MTEAKAESSSIDLYRALLPACDACNVMVGGDQAWLVRDGQFYTPRIACADTLNLTK